MIKSDQEHITEITDQLIDRLASPLISQLQNGINQDLEKIIADLDPLIKQSSKIADKLINGIFKKVHDSFIAGFIELEARNYGAPNNETKKYQPEPKIQCGLQAFKNTAWKIHYLFYNKSTSHNVKLDWKCATNIAFGLIFLGGGESLANEYSMAILGDLDRSFKKSPDLAELEVESDKQIVEKLLELGLKKVLENKNTKSINAKQIVNTVMQAYGIPDIPVVEKTSYGESYIGAFDPKAGKVLYDKKIMEEASKEKANLLIAYVFLHEARHCYQHVLMYNLMHKMGIELPAEYKFSEVLPAVEKCKDDAKAFLLSSTYVLSAQSGAFGKGVIAPGISENVRGRVAYQENYMEQDSDDFALNILSRITGKEVVDLEQEIDSQVKNVVSIVSKEEFSPEDTSANLSFLTDLELIAGDSHEDLLLIAGGLNPTDLASAKMFIGNSFSSGKTFEAEPADYDPDRNLFKGVERNLRTLIHCLRIENDPEIYQGILSMIKNKIPEKTCGELELQAVVNHFKQENKERNLTDNENIVYREAQRARKNLKQRQKRRMSRRSVLKESPLEKKQRVFRELNLPKTIPLNEVCVHLASELAKLDAKNNQNFKTEKIKVLLEHAEEILNGPAAGKTFIPKLVNLLESYKTTLKHQPELSAIIDRIKQTRGYRDVFLKKTLANLND